MAIKLNKIKEYRIRPFTAVFLFAVLVFVSILQFTDWNIFGASDYKITINIPSRPQKVIAKQGEISSIKYDGEQEFSRVYPIVWQGRVTNFFNSGQDIAVKRYTDTKYNHFYVHADGIAKNMFGQDVRVEGNMIGITCAYANTVFGQCVAEVEATKITLLN